MIRRRELLQALGSAAAAAFAETLFPVAAAGPPAFQAVAVNHISYYVRAYARSRDFYRGLLGMNVAYDDGRQCSLTFGDPPNAIYLRDAPRGAPARIDHLAFSVRNFQKIPAQTALIRRGLAPRPDGDSAWSVRDPNGFLVQICAEEGVFPGAESQWAKESDGTRNLKSLPAVAISGLEAVSVSISYRVANYARTVGFYASVLGMQPIAGNREAADLAFGADRLLVRQAAAPGAKPTVDSLAYAIRDWNRERVGAELQRRGLNPQPALPDAWTFADPDGFKIQIWDHEPLPA